MTRSRRRLVAWFGILGIAFAQIAVTAHACMLRSDAGAAPALAASALATTTPHHAHCAAALQGGEPATPQGNACEVQCSDGALSAAAPDMPTAALVSSLVPVAPLPLPVDSREWDRSVLAAASAGPPPLLQYCRLLN